MDPRLDMFADLGVMFPGLPVLLPAPPPSPASSLVTEPLLWDLGASEDFLLLRVQVLACIDKDVSGHLGIVSMGQVAHLASSHQGRKKC